MHAFELIPAGGEPVAARVSLFWLGSPWACSFLCLYSLFFEGSLFTSTLGPFTESMANVFLELASFTEALMLCYFLNRIWRRVQRNLSTSFQELKTRGSGVNLPGFLQSDPHADSARLLEAL